MQYTYYMHDEKEGALYSCKEILVELGLIDDSTDERDHPACRNLYKSIFQHEMEIVFDVSDDAEEVKVKHVKLGDGTILVPKVD